jgi:hypothetical protein
LKITSSDKAEILSTPPQVYRHEEWQNFLLPARVKQIAYYHAPDAEKRQLLKQFLETMETFKGKVLNLSTADISIKRSGAFFPYTFFLFLLQTSGKKTAQLLIQGC